MAIGKSTAGMGKNGRGTAEGLSISALPPGNGTQKESFIYSLRRKQHERSF